eukprot:CAMPEP_0168613260 /NCGR_PEP_ID=MMETSP0449_2-20121227/3357_1 /TAXON_ID=1082188 /ORGANISM="Strombidium rassoulzadegani, Strain ras09" /LENGTH=126 /DNA_ID=CAMNT_0008653883 /DNA_START=248 /DNA_END=629 /DNA_ORIENTATION=-
MIFCATEVALAAGSKLATWARLRELLWYLVYVREFSSICLSMSSFLFEHPCSSAPSSSPQPAPTLAALWLAPQPPPPEQASRAPSQHPPVASSSSRWQPLCPPAPSLFPVPPGSFEKRCLGFAGAG